MDSEGEIPEIIETAAYDDNTIEVHKDSGTTSTQKGTLDASDDGQKTKGEDVSKLSTPGVIPRILSPEVSQNIDEEIQRLSKETEEPEHAIENTKRLLDEIGEQMDISFERMEENQSSVKKYIQEREIAEEMYKSKAEEIMKRLDEGMKKLESLPDMASTAGKEMLSSTKLKKKGETKSDKLPAVTASTQTDEQEIKIKLEDLNLLTVTESSDDDDLNQDSINARSGVKEKSKIRHNPRKCGKEKTTAIVGTQTDREEILTENQTEDVNEIIDAIKDDLVDKLKHVASVDKVKRDLELAALKTELEMEFENQRERLLKDLHDGTDTNSSDKGNEEDLTHKMEPMELERETNEFDKRTDAPLVGDLQKASQKIQDLLADKKHLEEKLAEQYDRDEVLPSSDLFVNTDTPPAPTDTVLLSTIRAGEILGPSLGNFLLNDSKKDMHEIKDEELKQICDSVSLDFPIERLLKELNETVEDLSNKNMNNEVEIEIKDLISIRDPEKEKVNELIRNDIQKTEKQVETTSRELKSLGEEKSKVLADMKKKDDELSNAKKRRDELLHDLKDINKEISMKFTLEDYKASEEEITAELKDIAEKLADKAKVIEGISKNGFVVSLNEGDETEDKIFLKGKEKKLIERKMNIIKQGLGNSNISNLLDDDEGEQTEEIPSFKEIEDTLIEKTDCLGNINDIEWDIHNNELDNTVRRLKSQLGTKGIQSTADDLMKSQNLEILVLDPVTQSEVKELSTKMKELNITVQEHDDLTAISDRLRSSLMETDKETQRKIIYQLGKVAEDEELSKVKEGDLNRLTSLTNAIETLNSALDQSGMVDHFPNVALIDTLNHEKRQLHGKLQAAMVASALQSKEDYLVILDQTIASLKQEEKGISQLLLVSEILNHTVVSTIESQNKQSSNALTVDDMEIESKVIWAFNQNLAFVETLVHEIENASNDGIHDEFEDTGDTLRKVSDDKRINLIYLKEIKLYLEQGVEPASPENPIQGVLKMKRNLYTNLQSINTNITYHMNQNGDPHLLDIFVRKKLQIQDKLDHADLRILDKKEALEGIVEALSRQETILEQTGEKQKPFKVVHEDQVLQSLRDILDYHSLRDDDTDVSGNDEEVEEEDDVEEIDLRSMLRCRNDLLAHLGDKDRNSSEDLKDLEFEIHDRVESFMLPNSKKNVWSELDDDEVTNLSLNLKELKSAKVLLENQKKVVPDQEQTFNKDIQIAVYKILSTLHCKDLKLLSESYNLFRKKRDKISTVISSLKEDYLKLVSSIDEDNYSDEEDTSAAEEDGYTDEVMLEIHEELRRFLFLDQNKIPGDLILNYPQVIKTAFRPADDSQPVVPLDISTNEKEYKGKLEPKVIRSCLQLILQEREMRMEELIISESTKPTGDAIVEKNKEENRQLLTELQLLEDNLFDFSKSPIISDNLTPSDSLEYFSPRTTSDKNELAVLLEERDCVFREFCKTLNDQQSISEEDQPITNHKDEKEFRGAIEEIDDKIITVKEGYIQRATASSLPSALLWEFAAMTINEAKLIEEEVRYGKVYVRGLPAILASETLSDSKFKGTISPDINKDLAETEIYLNQEEAKCEIESMIQDQLIGASSILYDSSGRKPSFAQDREELIEMVKEVDDRLELITRRQRLEARIRDEARGKGKSDRVQPEKKKSEDMLTDDQGEEDYPDDISSPRDSLTDELNREQLQEKLTTESNKLKDIDNKLLGYLKALAAQNRSIDKREKTARLKISPEASELGDVVYSTIGSELKELENDKAELQKQLEGIRDELANASKTPEMATLLKKRIDIKNSIENMPNDDHISQLNGDVEELVGKLKEIQSQEKGLIRNLKYSNVKLRKLEDSIVETEAGSDTLETTTMPEESNELQEKYDNLPTILGENLSKLILESKNHQLEKDYLENDKVSYLHPVINTLNDGGSVEDIFEDDNKKKIEMQNELDDLRSECEKYDNLAAALGEHLSEIVLASKDRQLQKEYMENDSLSHLHPVVNTLKDGVSLEDMLLDESKKRIEMEEEVSNLKLECKKHEDLPSTLGEHLLKIAYGSKDRQLQKECLENDSLSHLHPVVEVLRDGGSVEDVLKEDNKKQIEMEEEIDELKTETARANATNQKLKEKLDDLGEEFQNLTEKVLEDERVIDEVRDKVGPDLFHILENFEADQSVDSPSHLQAVDTIRGSNKSLEQVLRGYEEELKKKEEREEEIKERDKEQEGLEAENESLKGMIAAMEEKLENVAKDLVEEQSLRVELENLAEQNEQEDLDNKEMQGRILAENKELHENIESLNGTIKKLEEELQASKSLQKDYDSLKDVLAEKVAKLNAALKNIDELNQDLNTKAELIEALEGEVNYLEKKLDETEDERIATINAKSRSVEKAKHQDVATQVPQEAEKKQNGDQLKEEETEKLKTAKQLKADLLHMIDEAEKLKKDKDIYLEERDNLKEKLDSMNNNLVAFEKQMKDVGKLLRQEMKLIDPIVNKSEIDDNTEQAPEDLTKNPTEGLQILVGKYKDIIHDLKEKQSPHKYSVEHSDDSLQDNVIKELPLDPEKSIGYFTSSIPKERDSTLVYDSSKREEESLVGSNEDVTMEPMHPTTDTSRFDAEEQNKSLKEDIKVMEKTVTDRDEEIERLKANLIDLKQKVEKLATNEKELQNKHDSLSEQNSQLAFKADKLADQKREVEENLNSMTEQKDQLHNKVSELSKALTESTEELGATNDELKSKLNNLLEQKRNLEAINEQTVKEKEDLEKRLAKTLQEQSKTEVEQEKITAELTRTVKELEELKKSYENESTKKDETTNAKVTEKDETIAGLLQEKTELENKLQGSLQKLYETEKELQSLSEGHKDLTERGSEMLQIFEILDEENKSKALRIEELQERLNTKETDVVTLKKNLEAEADYREKQRISEENLKLRLEEEKENLEEFKKNISDLQHALDKKSEENHRLREKEIKFQESMKSLEKKLEDMENIAKLKDDNLRQVETDLSNIKENHIALSNAKDESEQIMIDREESHIKELKALKEKINDLGKNLEAKEEELKAMEREFKQKLFDKETIHSETKIELTKLVESLKAEHQSKIAGIEERTEEREKATNELKREYNKQLKDIKEKYEDEIRTKEKQIRESIREKEDSINKMLLEHNEKRKESENNLRQNFEKEIKSLMETHINDLKEKERMIKKYKDDFEDSLNISKEEHSEDLRKSNAKLDDLQNEMENMNNDYLKIKKELEMTKQERLRLQEEVDNFKSSYEEAKRDKTIVQYQLKEYEESIQNQSQLNKELDRAMKTLDNEVKLGEKHRERLTSENDALRKEKRNLEAGIAEQITIVKTQKQKLKELKGKNETNSIQWEQERKRLVDSLAETETRIKALTEKEVELTNKLSMERQRFEKEKRDQGISANEEISSFQRIIKGLEMKLDDKDDAIYVLKKSVENLKAENESKVNILHDRKEEQRKQINTLQIKISDLENMVERKKSEIALKNREVDRLRVNYEQEKQVGEAKDDKIRQLKKRAADLKNEFDQNKEKLEHSLLESKATILSLQTDIDSVRIENNELKDFNKELKSKINEQRSYEEYEAVMEKRKVELEEIRKTVYEQKKQLETEMKNYFEKTQEAIKKENEAKYAQQLERKRLLMNKEKEKLSHALRESEQKIEESTRELRRVKDSIQQREIELKQEEKILVENLENEFKRKMEEIIRENYRERQKLTKTMQEDREKFEEELRGIKNTMNKECEKKLSEQQHDMERDFQDALFEMLKESKESIEELQNRITNLEKDKRTMKEKHLDEKERVEQKHSVERAALESTVKELLRTLIKYRDERIKMKGKHKDEIVKLEEEVEIEKSRLEIKSQQDVLHVRQKLQTNYEKSLESERSVMENKFENIRRDWMRDLKRTKLTESRYTQKEDADRTESKKYQVISWKPSKKEQEKQNDSLSKETGELRRKIMDISEQLVTLQTRKGA